jgi:hypothetical protein
MYGLTHQEALDAQKDLMSKFNPSNPEHVKKLKSLTEQASGGKRTILTEKELYGKGIRRPWQVVGEYGFTVSETEQEKQKYNPNSAQFKRRLIAEQNKTKEREWELKKYGHSKI